MLVAPLSPKRKKERKPGNNTRALSEIYTTLWLISAFVLTQCIGSEDMAWDCMF